MSARLTQVYAQASIDRAPRRRPTTLVGGAILAATVFALVFAATLYLLS